MAKSLCIHASVQAPGPLSLGLFPASVLPGDHPPPLLSSPRGSGWAKPTSYFQRGVGMRAGLSHRRAGMTGSRTGTGPRLDAEDDSGLWKTLGKRKAL